MATGRRNEWFGMFAAGIERGVGIYQARLSRSDGSVRGRIHVGLKAVSNPCGGGLHRVARKVSVAGGCLDLAVAEELPGHRQAFTERERPGGKAVTQVRHGAGTGAGSADEEPAAERRSAGNRYSAAGKARRDATPCGRDPGPANRDSSRVRSAGRYYPMECRSQARVVWRLPESDGWGEGCARLNRRGSSGRERRWRALRGNGGTCESRLMAVRADFLYERGPWQPRTAPSWQSKIAHVAARASGGVFRGRWPAQDGFDKEAQRWSGAALGVGAQSLPKRLRNSIREKKNVLEQNVNLVNDICIQEYVNPSLPCAVERRHSSAGANPARQLSLQPVAVGAGEGGNEFV